MSQPWRIFLMMLIFFAARAEVDKAGSLGLALSVTTPAGAAVDERDRIQDLLRAQRQPIRPGEPVDFNTLRGKADAIATALKLNLKIHEIGGVLQFPSAGIRFAEIAFLYFRPLPRPERWTWEELKIAIHTPRKELSGSIAGFTKQLESAVPEAAPSNIIAPEKALALLNRGALESPTPQEPRKDPSEWKLNIQLLKVGAKYWAAAPDHYPFQSLNTGFTGIYREEPFFVSTAPRGNWIWWTIARHMPGNSRYKYVYEFIYMDAATGNATSHCAEQPREYTPLAATACPAQQRR
jgi:hypothetical protein